LERREKSPSKVTSKACSYGFAGVSIDVSESRSNYRVKELGVARCDYNSVVEDYLLNVAEDAAKVTVDPNKIDRVVANLPCSIHKFTSAADPIIVDIYSIEDSLFI